MSEFLIIDRMLPVPDPTFVSDTAGVCASNPNTQITEFIMIYPFPYSIVAFVR